MLISLMAPPGRGGWRFKFPMVCVAAVFTCACLDDALRQVQDARGGDGSHQPSADDPQQPAVAPIWPPSTVAAAAAGALAIACDDTIEEAYLVPPELPPYDPLQRGTVVRCARDLHLDAAAVDAIVRAGGYGGETLTSGVTILRLAYRTERVPLTADPAVRPGLASALLLLPDTPRALPGPLVVAAHGSVGLARDCAPSLQTMDSTRNVNSYHLMTLGPAGAGYVVVAPDYAGFRFAPPLQGWSSSPDEAQSLLDAIRAASRAMGAGTFNSRAVLLGHSQGGHAVLSAHALARGYDSDGAIAGVLAFAPAWFAPRAYAATLSPWAEWIGLANNTNVSYGLLYLYGHGELLDGPGGGVTMFLPEKREAAAALLGDSCLGRVFSDLDSLGASTADYLDPDFLELVASECALFGACRGELATRWETRFRADRPAVDRLGAPMVIWHGRRDKTITADLAVCGFDAIRRDLAPRAADASATAESPPASLTVCADATANHGNIVPRGLPWVLGWIGARGLDLAEPPACADESLLATDGQPLMCPILPSND